MLKTMLAMVAVAMTLQTAPVPAAPARRACTGTDC